MRGEAVQVVEYKPFGVERYVLNPLIEAGPRYTGQVFDLDTDLYYYNARYYDPALGRFIQPDSIIQDPYSPQLLNPYSYAANNPLKYVDPTGNITADGPYCLETEFLQEQDPDTTQVEIGFGYRTHPLGVNFGSEPELNSDAMVENFGGVAMMSPLAVAILGSFLAFTNFLICRNHRRDARKPGTALR